MAFRDYILHNFWWKLLSLLLAALTWLTIETAFKKEETLRDTPVVTGSSSRSFPSVAVTLLSSAANTGRYTVTPQDGDGGSERQTGRPGEIAGAGHQGLSWM